MCTGVVYPGCVGGWVYLRVVKEPLCAPRGGPETASSSRFTVGQYSQNRGFVLFLLLLALKLGQPVGGGDPGYGGPSYHPGICLPPGCL